jgi:ribonuclease J
MEEVRTAAKRVLAKLLDDGVTDWGELKGKVRDELSRLLFKKTKRRPMILPILMDL